MFGTETVGILLALGTVVLIASIIVGLFWLMHHDLFD